MLEMNNQLPTALSLSHCDKSLVIRDSSTVTTTHDEIWKTDQGIFIVKR